MYILRTALAATLLTAVSASIARSGEPEWIRQFGTLEDDGAAGVAVGPDGRVHVVGRTDGHFFGSSKGSPDALVITFDGDGKQLWRRQPGLPDTDTAAAVATDLNGNVYVVGTGGYSSNEDTRVIAFDRDGRIRWKRRPGETGADRAQGVATDAHGNVYVVGGADGALDLGYLTHDAFVIKFDPNGRILWKRQRTTTPYDYAYAVATDADGNVYVVGWTSGTLGGTNKGADDAFVIKFDPDGRTLWKRQPGSSKGDIATGVATDADGDVYVVGYTSGTLAGANKGSDDAFIIKYDRDGRGLWRDQPGTSDDDHATGVATDGDGNVYVVGFTQGSLAGAKIGGADAFVIKYDRNGEVAWKDQPGTPFSDYAMGVATDGDANVYVAGWAYRARPYDIDDFLIKYGPGGPQ